MGAVTTGTPLTSRVPVPLSAQPEGQGAPTMRPTQEVGEEKGRDKPEIEGIYQMPGPSTTVTSGLLWPFSRSG